MLLYIVPFVVLIQRETSYKHKRNEERRTIIISLKLLIPDFYRVLLSFFLICDMSKRFVVFKLKTK